MSPGRKKTKRRREAARNDPSTSGKKKSSAPTKGKNKGGKVKETEPKRTRRPDLVDLEDRVLYEACMRFLINGHSAQRVAEWLTDELDLGEFGREQIYPLVAQAVRRRVVVVKAPRSTRMEEKIAQLFQFTPPALSVVDADSAVLDNVARRAALVIAELIEQEWDPEGPPYTIGFAPGRTMSRTCIALCRRLSRRIDPPRLRLVALVPGLLMRDPETSPSSFITVFRDYPGRVEYFPLYARPIVRISELGRIWKEPLTRDCYAIRNEIDLVVTSCEVARHDYSRLRRALSHVCEDEPIPKDSLGTADLLFQPYNEDGAVDSGPDAYRAVSLFGWPELRERHREGRHTLLVAASLDDQHDKTEAVRPLFDNRSLSILSHAVLCAETAKGLLGINGRP